MAWLHGETVTVYGLEGPGSDEPTEDEHGDPIETWDGGTKVPNVLVMPTAGEDLKDPVRPDGVRVSYRLALPKAFTRSMSPGALRGCMVALSDRGQGLADALKVSGEPDRFMPCPTEWDTLVYVGRTDG